MEPTISGKYDLDTPCLTIDIDILDLTELQVGSYAVMDTEYWHIGSKDDPDCFYITKGDNVIDKWPIDLRGRSQ